MTHSIYDKLRTKTAHIFAQSQKKAKFVKLIDSDTSLELIVNDTISPTFGLLSIIDEFELSVIAVWG